MMAGSLLDQSTETVNPSGDNADLLGNKTQSASTGSAEGTVELKEWMKSLTGDLKTSKSLSKFGDTEALAKSYLEAESELGRRVRIPSQDASSEEWAKFYEKVGRPKSPDEYAIDRGRADDGLVKAFKKAAHEAGLSSTQADRIFKELNGFTQSSKQAEIEQYTARMKEADLLLRKEYGPQYDTRLADARKAYETLFDEDLRGDIAASGIASNPRFIKVLAALGPQIRGDSFLQGAGNTGTGTKNPLAWMDEKYGQAR
jgi:hypothetical protein